MEAAKEVDKKNNPEKDVEKGKEAPPVGDGKEPSQKETKVQKGAKKKSAKEKDKDKEKVDTKFGLFREHEIDIKLKEAKEEAPPAVLGEGEELVKTEIKLEKMEATKGTHAIRWLEQEGEKRVFVKEYVYDPKTGNWFLSYVFLILLTMLLITGGFNALLVFKYPRQTVFHTHSGSCIYYSIISLLAVNYYWACSSWARVKPQNIIGLILGTAAMSSLIAGLSTYYKIHYSFLLILSGLSAAVFFMLFLSFTRCYNFTKAFLFLLIVPLGASALAVLATFATMFGYLPKKSTDMLPYEMGITAVILILLVVELRLILGGHYVDVMEDDQSFVAWLLYSSTLTFVLKLVQTFDLVDTD